MAENTVNKTISVRKDQGEWLDNQPRTFNLSELVQKAIDKEMKKGKVV